MTDTHHETIEDLERELRAAGVDRGGDRGMDRGPDQGDDTLDSEVVTGRLERSITQVARAILRLSVPEASVPGGVTVDKAGYWLLVRTSELAPVRLSELADSVELDLSTVSRQVRDLVGAGLLDRAPDPADGRATLVSLTAQGLAVLDAVSEARRTVLDEAVADWSPEERQALADGLTRLGAALHDARECHPRPGRPDAAVPSTPDDGSTSPR
jgi:DNA-binding MarR family transcriptional regulator